LDAVQKQRKAIDLIQEGKSTEALCLLMS
jgi:hypothetical protein